MRSHTMNATGLGSKSYENDQHVTLVTPAAARLRLPGAPPLFGYLLRGSQPARIVGLPHVLGLGGSLRRCSSRGRTS